MHRKSFLIKDILQNERDGDIDEESADGFQSTSECVVCVDSDEYLCKSDHSSNELHESSLFSRPPLWPSFAASRSPLSYFNPITAPSSTSWSSGIKTKGVSHINQNFSHSVLYGTTSDRLAVSQSSCKNPSINNFCYIPSTVESVQVESYAAFEANPNGSLNNTSPNQGGESGPRKVPRATSSTINVTTTSSNSPSRKMRRNRTVFTELQLMGLERRFDSQKYLSTPDRAELARALGLTQLQVKTWYQVMQGGCPIPPTKPKGRPKKNSIPSMGMTLDTALFTASAGLLGQKGSTPHITGFIQAASGM